MSLPGVSSITAANDGTGTSATITIAGNAVGELGGPINVATLGHLLFYRKLSDTAWTTGLTRTGDGTIVQTGLTAGHRYEFVELAEVVTGPLKERGYPSGPVFVHVFATATAIKELIRQNIKSELEELVSDGTVTEVICPKRYGEDPTFQNKTLILIQEDPELAEPTADGASTPAFQTWDQRFAVLCCIRLAEGSATDVDQEINDLEAEVVKKLCEERGRGTRPVIGGTYALDTMIDPPEFFPPNRRGVDGIRVNFRVRFRIREDDPYSQT